MTRLQLRHATADDLDWIHELRHRVYAEELGQYAVDASGRLTDDLDGENTYLVAASGDTRVGFVSLTPPWLGRYRLDRYVTRAALPLLDEPDVFEVRVLTVEPAWRDRGVATALMYATLRWTASRGGRTIVAMGRADLLDMYRAVGLAPTGQTIHSGSVDFEVMTASVGELRALAAGPFADLVTRWQSELDWRLDVPLAIGADDCDHGGRSFTAIGADFRTLDRRADIVAADVLDAWFEPAPAVRELLTRDPGWLARTSPPTRAEGVLAEIAAVRGLPETSLAVGAGSSDLIFRAFTHWLTPQSRVLLVDPGYGEYAHVTEQVIGCRVDRFSLRREDDWRIDPEPLAEQVGAGRYDLVVLVNPNNPTGRHLPAATLRRLVEATPAGTRWWIDEAYVGYVGLAESMADLAARDPCVVVCTSLSKMYALSGLRAAFLTATPEVAGELRRLTPPWQLSLPAQLAAVAALRDPAHYLGCWQRTHELRDELVEALAAVDGWQVTASVANFVTVRLPTAGPSAAAFVEEGRRHGVHLRDLSPMSPSYEGRTVRISVRDTAENVRIVGACAAALDTLRPVEGAARAGSPRA